MDAEGAEAIVTSDFTSYFRLHASYFVQRHSMPGAGTRSVESPWLTHDGFSLARTAEAEGAEVIVTSYFRLHAAYFTPPYDRTRLPRWLV